MSQKLQTVIFRKILARAHSIEKKMQVQHDTKIYEIFLWLCPLFCKYIVPRVGGCVFFAVLGLVDRRKRKI